jgi:DNA-binding transcriptional MerR regulator
VGAGVTDGPTLRIGEAAERAGVTTRTLRYYQELGLLDPADHRPGGNRRYSDADVARLLRILELRDVMGFDLERIRTILDAEDRLAALRHEYRRGRSEKRKAQIVGEAIDINRLLREQVRDKIKVLEAFLDDLEDASVRYRAVADELGVASEVRKAAAATSDSTGQ